MAQVARWRRLRRALEPRTEHNGASKRDREETAAAQDLPSWRQYGHEEGHHDALRIAMRTTNARSTRGPPASQGPAMRLLEELRRIYRSDRGHVSRGSTRLDFPEAMVLHIAAVSGGSFLHTEGG